MRALVRAKWSEVGGVGVRQAGSQRWKKWDIYAEHAHATYYTTAIFTPQKTGTDALFPNALFSYVLPLSLRWTLEKGQGHH